MSEVVIIDAVGVDPVLMLTGPIDATDRLPDRSGLGSTTSTPGWLCSPRRSMSSNEPAVALASAPAP